MAKKKIKVDKIDISIIDKSGMDFISITDVARNFSDSPNDSIKSYLRNGQNLEYMSAWEQLHNPDFKTVVADLFRINSVKNSFTLSVSSNSAGFGGITPEAMMSNPFISGIEKIISLISKLSFFI